MNKEEFMEKMSKLYDNYTKVEKALGKDDLDLVRYYINNSQLVQTAGRYIRQMCWQAWDKFCEVVKGIDTLEYIDLLKYIAGNKLCVDEFIESCIN